MITEGRKYLVGCDCSFNFFGVCKYDPDTNAMILFTGTLLEAVSWIGKNCVLSNCVAVIEDPNLNSPLFKASGILRMELGKFKKGEIGEGAVMATFSRLSTMAQSLGKSKASADLIISLFRGKNVPVITIAPSDRHRADKPPRSGKAPLSIGMMAAPTKTSAYQFEQLTGYTGRSSEHSRDSATLCWGKNMQWAEGMLQRNLEEKLTVSRKLKSTTGEEVGVRNGKFTILNTVEKR